MSEIKRREWKLSGGARVVWSEDEFITITTNDPKRQIAGLMETKEIPELIKILEEIKRRHDES